MKTRLLAGAGIATALFFAVGFWVYALMPRPVDAARNASGTFSKLYTFSPGSVINSSNMNSQFSDFETEMSDSKSRSGKGDFSAPVRGADGTVAAPTWSYTSETGSGLYRIGSSDHGFSMAGTKVGEWTANGYRTANGAVATPSLSFFNDTGGGLYRIGSNDFGFAVNGAKVQEWTAAGSSVTGTFSSSSMLGIGAAPSNWLDITISGSATTNIGNWLEASLADGNSMTLNVGKAASAGSLGIVTYTKNATAANSTFCLSVFGASSTLCVDGNGKTYIGASGTGTTQMNFGSCTLNGASPSVCTATVASGAKCVATDVATTAATRCLATSVTTTTLTVTSCNGNTNVVNYVCF